MYTRKVFLHKSTYSRVPRSWEQLPVRDRGNGSKARPVVYRWTNGAGWVTPTSSEAVRMKAVNHKPINHPKKTPPIRAERRSDEQVRGG